jgi:uncharacterized repeat protein (TIGR03847 family)
MRHEFTTPERFVAGTVGEPGERAFYLQIRTSSRLFSVAVEKAQVQAMSSRLEVMIAEIRKSNPSMMIDKLPTDDAPLESPIDAEFQIGAMSLAWDNDTKLICVELFELEDDEEDSEGEVVVINISLAMAAAFFVRSKAVVNAGRLPCPFCGIPIDPRGHLCPRANGYRR